MPNFLITGGAGFIGSHLTDRLLQTEENSVVVLDNFDDFYSRKAKEANLARHRGNPRFELIPESINDRDALMSVFSFSRIDAIVHLAARAGVRPSISNPLEYELTNVRGTVQLLEMARAFKVPKFIFGSSSSVYGAGAVPPFSEDSRILPINPYAASKAAGESFVHSYSHLFGISAVCLRFFTVFGPRQRPDLAIHKFARLISEDKPIPVYGNGKSARDYTFVSDIVDGIIRAIEYSASSFEIINLGGSQAVELNQLIETLERQMNREAKIDRMPAHPGDLDRTQANIDKARSLLGWEPHTGLDEGISEFLEWFNSAS